MKLYLLFKYINQLTDLKAPFQQDFLTTLQAFSFFIFFTTSIHWAVINSSSHCPCVTWLPGQIKNVIIPCKSTATELCEAVYNVFSPHAFSPKRVSSLTVLSFPLTVFLPSVWLCGSATKRWFYCWAPITVFLHRSLLSFLTFMAELQAANSCQCFYRSIFFFFFPPTFQRTSEILWLV